MGWVKSAVIHFAAYLVFVTIYFLVIFCMNYLAIQPGQGSLVKPIVPYFSSAIGGILGAGMGIGCICLCFPSSISTRFIFWSHFLVVMCVQTFILLVSLWLYVKHANDIAFLYTFFAAEPITVYIHTITALSTAWKLSKK